MTSLKWWESRVWLLKSEALLTQHSLMLHAQTVLMCWKRHFTDNDKKNRFLNSDIRNIPGFFFCLFLDIWFPSACLKHLLPSLPFLTAHWELERTFSFQPKVLCTGGMRAIAESRQIRATTPIETVTMKDSWLFVAGDPGWFWGSVSWRNIPKMDGWIPPYFQNH